MGGASVFRVFMGVCRVLLGGRFLFSFIFGGEFLQGLGGFFFQGLYAFFVFFVGSL